VVVQHLMSESYRSSLLSRTCLETKTFFPQVCQAHLLLHHAEFILIFLGGVLGFCCAHQYAHTNSSSAIRIPRVLKGMDMALYAVFRALGLRLDVLPVLDQGGFGIEIGGIDYTRPMDWRFGERKERNQLEEFRQMGYSVEWQDGKKRRVDELKLKYDDSAIDPSLDFKKRLATLLYTRRIIGVESKAEEVIVGTALSEQTITDEGGDEMDDTNVSFSSIVYSFLEQKTNFQ
jgi:hypothetical protein